MKELNKRIGGIAIHNQSVSIKNETAGITLIALVITIIVLLILAGVSIATLTGNNGILTQAKKSQIENRAGEVEEQINLWKTQVNAGDYVEWNSESENEILTRLQDKKLILPGELDETNKTITIGERVISYSITKESPYEIRRHTTDSNLYIMLYNKETGQYETFGKRIIIELESGMKIDRNVESLIKISYDYPLEAPKIPYLFIFDIEEYYENANMIENVKITIYKNNTITTWSGVINYTPS